MFDIIRFYQEHKVDYHLSGKNVMEGWVNICCPFCPDKSNHLGVFINRPRKVKCWRCGEHNLPEVLSHFSDKDIKTLYREYKTEGEDADIVPEQIEKPTISLEEIQKTFQENSTPYIVFGYKHYLINRKFNPEEINKDWGVYGGTEMGEYRYRLMIPIIHNMAIVSFQGRDVTGKQDPKYKTCHGTKIHDYLYGLDYVHRDRVIITEGVTDVWRLGKGNAVATFGTNYSSKQIELIVRKGIKQAVVFFDGEKEAQFRAGQLTADLELFDIRWDNLCLKDRDPASLSKREAREIVNRYIIKV